MLIGNLYHNCGKSNGMGTMASILLLPEDGISHLKLRLLSSWILSAVQPSKTQKIK